MSATSDPTEGAYPLPQSPFARLVVSVLGDANAPHQLRVDASHLHIETQGFKNRKHQLPLETLTGIRVIRGKLGSLLTIEAGELNYNFRLGRRASGADELVALVRRRIAELPSGDLVLQTIDAREEVVAQLVRYRAWWIWVLVPLLAAAYGARYVREKSVFNLDYFGSCARFWVARGEIYRLFTGTWLHGDLWHIGGNLVVIVWLGRAVERVLGPARLAIIMTASGLTAALGSLWLAPGGSIGASGVGMGLAGSFGVIAFAYRTQLPRPVAKPWWWWLIFGLLLMPTPDGPGDLAIDHAAHAAGAIGGGLATWLLIARVPVSAVRVRRLGWLAIVCVLAHATALAAFTVRVQQASTLGELARIDRLFTGGAVDDDIVNELTWAVALDKEADRPTIDASLALAEKVSHRFPTNWQLADTVASLHHRAGGDKRAAELEARALETSEAQYDGTVHATQLARFMVAAADKLTARGVRITASDKALQVTFDDDEAGDTLRRSGVVVYAVAMRHGQIQGTVRVAIASGSDAQRTVRVRPEDVRGGVLGEIASPVGVDVVYGPVMLRSGCPYCRAGSATAAAWPVDPDALAWP